MRIDQIIDPNFKSGTSQSGKPWSLMQVKVGDNIATIFAPAAVGDEVKLIYNDKFKNYTAEKMTAAKKERDEIVEKLDEILRILGGSQGKGVTTPAPPSEVTPQSPGVPPSVSMVFPEAEELPPVDLYDS